MASTKCTECGRGLTWLRVGEESAAAYHSPRGWRHLCGLCVQEIAPAEDEQVYVILGDTESAFRLRRWCRE